jgi:hypothetical protein
MLLIRLGELMEVAKDAKESLNQHQDALSTLKTNVNELSRDVVDTAGHIQPRLQRGGNKLSRRSLMRIQRAGSAAKQRVNQTTMDFLNTK